MSGDVITTIKEYLWIVALIGLLLSVLNAYFGGGWGRGGISWTFALSRTRKLRRLQGQRAWLQRMHDSDREYHGWLLACVLTLLGLLGVQLAIEGLMALFPVWNPQLQYYAITIERLAMGTSLYTFAVRRLQGNRWLWRDFEGTAARLDHAINTLKAKLGVDQPRYASH